jgi:hypothetical protein
MWRETLTKRYEGRLSKDERERGWVLLKKGKTSARKLCRAQILSHADGGASDTAIATAVPEVEGDDWACLLVHGKLEPVWVRFLLHEPPRFVRLYL